MFRKKEKNHNNNVGLTKKTTQTPSAFDVVPVEVIEYMLRNFFKTSELAPLAFVNKQFNKLFTKITNDYTKIVPVDFFESFPKGLMFLNTKQGIFTILDLVSKHGSDWVRNTDRDTVAMQRVGKLSLIVYACLIALNRQKEEKIPMKHSVQQTILKIKKFEITRQRDVEITTDDLEKFIKLFDSTKYLDQNAFASSFIEKVNGEIGEALENATANTAMLTKINTVISELRELKDKALQGGLKLTA